MFTQKMKNTLKEKLYELSSNSFDAIYIMEVYSLFKGKNDI